ncbi:hypothetical protein [Streptomonospora arabica]|uniref:Uncharacterized protein n=1 Tax=Streptomonospora arabica TaxID=412417 RepID=A0ABV9SSL2_9ACTN
MAVRVCSLIRSINQTIPADGSYHLVRFPFGSEGPESYDAWGMHDACQPDDYAVTDWDTDDRSGLIWPSMDGWGDLTAMVYWAPGGYNETRDRFVRDPLNLSTGYDSTATEDEAPTPGGQYKHKCHGIFVHPGTPVGFMVRVAGSQPVDITHAQFKLAIHPVESPPA